MIALMEKKISQRRACQIVKINRSTLRYEKKPAKDDSAIRQAMQKLAQHPHRRGFPWMLRRLRKDGFKDNHKRLERIYCEERLQLPRKSRKRYRGPKLARYRAERINQIWCADFISDSTENGRQGRILNLLDEHSRYSIDMFCSASIPGQQVKMILDRAMEYRQAKPEVLVVDNGPEFICNLLEEWGRINGVHLHFIDKGKPTQNCFVESFHSTLRRELLNKHCFWNIAELRDAVLKYREFYNFEREHSSLGWLTPEEFEDGLLLASSPTAPRLAA